MSKSKTKLEIMRLPHAAGLPLPAYQSAGAAGLDLMAAVPEDAPVTTATRPSSRNRSRIVRSLTGCSRSSIRFVIRGRSPGP